MLNSGFINSKPSHSTITLVSILFLSVLVSSNIQEPDCEKYITVCEYMFGYDDLETSGNKVFFNYENNMAELSTGGIGDWKI